MRRLLILFALAVFAAPVSGQSYRSPQTLPDLVERASPAVFRIVAEFGEGTGFLIDERGYVVTNAHVVSGVDSLAVRIDNHYLVSARVVHRDEVSDVAILRVHPEAVRGRPGLELDSVSYRDLRVGEELLILGYPLRKGVVSTTGVLSRKGDRSMLTDGAMHPGNSGGPVLDMEGRVVGMSTFGALVGRAGPGLGGAVPAHVVLRSIQGIALAGGAVSPPPDSLPLIPADDYPMESLIAAMEVEDWPSELYDVSDESFSDAYRVTIDTPASIIRSNAAWGDLTDWRNEVGGPAPVVVARILEQVGQSWEGFFSSLALGEFMYVPKTQRDLIHVRLQDQESAFVTPIHRRRRVTTSSGVSVRVLHLIYPPDIFRPLDDGSFRAMVFNILNEDGANMPTVVPAETVEQIYNDFRLYLARR